jgi:predicted MPP superfamily phosphohydrolase
MSGTTALIIVSVGAIVPTLWYAFKYEWRQLVVRPFLSSKHQPSLLVDNCCCWPPKWPILADSPPRAALDPDNPNDNAYDRWVYRWKIHLAGWLTFFLWIFPWMLSNAIPTNVSGTPNFFVVLSFCIMGVLIIIPFACGMTDAITGIAFLYCKYKNIQLPNKRPNWEMERWSLVMCFLFSFSMVAFSTGYSWGKDGPITKTIEVPLARLPSCLDGLKVFLITDVHTGPNVSENFIIETVRTANNLKPDIVLHVGDGGDGKPSDIGKFNEPYKDLLCTKRYFVTGNHEYLHGANGKDWEEFYSNIGFDVLHNKASKIGAAEFPNRSCGINDKLALVGVPDIRSSDTNLKEALSTVAPNEEWILLSHQPAIFSDSQLNQNNIDNTHVGLQVSGHIHAGQCFPLHPIIYLTSKGLFSGLIKQKKSYIFVSNGNANWGTRVRLFSSPHNTIIILRNEEIFNNEGKTVNLDSTSEVKWAITGFVIIPLWLLVNLYVYIQERYKKAWWIDYDSDNSDNNENNNENEQKLPIHASQGVSIANSLINKNININENKVVAIADNDNVNDLSLSMSMSMNMSSENDKMVASL